MMPVILLMIVLFDKLRHQPAPLPAVGHWDETLSANYSSGGEPALAGAQVAHAEYREGLHGNAADDGQVVNHGVVQSSSMDVLRQVGFWKSMHISTSETVGHIGALVILMALSVSVGGLLERTEVMSFFPTDISSTFLVITLILGLMVF